MGLGACLVPCFAALFDILSMVECAVHGLGQLCIRAQLESGTAQQTLWCAPLIKAITRRQAAIAGKLRSGSLLYPEQRPEPNIEARHLDVRQSR